MSYEGARIYDAKWQRRKYWLLLAFARQQKIQWRKVRLSNLAGMMMIPKMPTSDLLKISEKLTGEMYELLFGLPPESPDVLQDSQSQWERAFGCHLSDPETQRNIDLACQGLEAARSKK